MLGPETLGFPDAPLKQRHLPSGRRPDLIASDVAGDVKRRVTRIDGPAEMEAYLDELDTARPAEAPWRGLLVHRHDDLDKATRDRVATSRHALEVWAVGDASIPTRRHRSSGRPTRAACASACNSRMGERSSSSASAR
jgi:hypothetical protein